MSERKLVLTTIGSLGDLHPFIAIALSLKELGFRPVMAVAHDHVGKCRAAGLDAAAVLPSFSDVARRMGLTEQDATGRIMSDQRQMLEQVILPALSTCAALLDDLANDAAAIVSSVFVLAAPMVAEKRGLPLIPVVLQPMAILSPYDAPHAPDFWMMKHHPVHRLGAQWNRLVYGTMREILNLLYGKQIDRVRAELGLRPRGGRQMLEAGRSAPLTLCCYTEAFGPLPPDAPSGAKIVGFPLFDRDGEPGEVLAPELEAFIADGPAPVVFTLGSFAVQAAGSFYQEAAKATRQLGVRAVLLTGSADQVGPRGDVFVCDYAPHSLLFPHMSLVVHHGGVGTTGQALRAGKPQLVVPHMGDQYDHANRIARMGVGLVLAASQFTAARAASLLDHLLGDERVKNQAASVAHGMADANPSRTAAEMIAMHLRQKK